MRLACAAPVLAALLAGCWTRPDPAPVKPKPEEPPPAPRGFEISMSRMPCRGTCPVYTVWIRADGKVDYRGGQNVTVVGDRHGTADPTKLAALASLLEQVDFFSLDDRGRLHPEHPDAFMCHDGSTTIIEAERDGKAHKIALTHCESLPAHALEAAIDDVAQTRFWVFGG
ncbi:MAG: hypothetical protein KIT31_30275 [Deltaproteobacteria bacterium]|nr:hypothetical protein [Deltaproteobacteria bacterium]